MTNYLLLMRGSYPDRPPTREVIARIVLEWGEWYGKIAASGNIADYGNPIAPGGRRVTADGISDGAVMSGSACVNGYVIIKAESMDEAVRVAQSCPAVKEATIEVREIVNHEELIKASRK